MRQRIAYGLQRFDKLIRYGDVQSGQVAGQPSARQPKLISATTALPLCESARTQEVPCWR